jgi:iron complex transport system substrate-binding protein
MRLASLSPATTEILHALGCADQIVCTDQFSNFPEDVKAIPHLRDHMKITPEDLRTHQPELVLTATKVQERLAMTLEDAGFSVLHQDPRTIHAIFESIRQLGLLLDCEPQAETLIRTMQEGFNDVKRKASKLPWKAKLYIEEWHDPPYASGNWVPEVAKIAGGRQFPIASGELSREVTLHEVQDFDPDMIVISWCGAGALPRKEILTEREGWGILRAVKEDAVRVIDDNFLNRPGPRLVEGAQRLYAWIFEHVHAKASVS